MSLPTLDVAYAAPSTDTARQNIVCLLVEHAGISLRKVGPPKDYLALANYGHEVHSGNSVIFVLRRFIDNGQGVDSAHFEKFTARLAQDAGENGFIPSESIGVASGYYTEGGVGFINKGAYWRSKSTNPVSSITFVATSSGFDAEINATFDAVYEMNKSKREVKIEARCPVHRVSVSRLTAWEGKPGSAWSSFAPAPGEGLLP